MKIQDYIHFKNNVWFAKCKITPKAHKNELFSVLDDGTLKVRIKAVPEKWKANTELIKFLSKELWINKKNIDIVSGKTEQVKRIKINLSNI